MHGDPGGSYMSQDLFAESQYGPSAPSLNEPWLKPFRCEHPRSTLSCCFNKNGSQCSPPSIRQLEHLPAIIHVGSRSKKSFPSHELATIKGVEFVFGTFCQLIIAYRDEESTSKQNELFADIHCLFGLLEYMGRMNLPEPVSIAYEDELKRMLLKCYKLPKDFTRIVDNHQAHISIFHWKLAVSCKNLADSNGDVMLCVIFGLVQMMDRMTDMISCACVQDLLVSIFTERYNYLHEHLPSLVDQTLKNQLVRLSNGAMLGVLSPLSILRFFDQAVQHLASKITDASIPLPWAVLMLQLCDKLLVLHFAKVCTVLWNFLKNGKCGNLEKCRSKLTPLLLNVIRHLEKNPVAEVEHMIDNPEEWARAVGEQFDFQDFPSQDAFSLLHFLMKQEVVWNAVRNSVVNQFSAAVLNSYTSNFGTMFSILFLLSDNDWFAEKLQAYLEGAIETSEKLKSLLRAVEAFAYFMKERNSAISKKIISKALKRLTLPADGKELIEKAAEFQCYDEIDLNTVCKQLNNRDMGALLSHLTNSRQHLDSSAVWLRAIKMLSEGTAEEQVINFIGLKLQVDGSKGNDKNLMIFLNCVLDKSKKSVRTSKILLPILSKVFEFSHNFNNLIISKCIGLWIYCVCAFSLSHEDSVYTLSTCMWELLRPNLLACNPEMPLQMTSFPKPELNIIHFFEVLESSRIKINARNILKDWFTIEWVNLLKPLITGSENAFQNSADVNHAQVLATELSCYMFIKLGSPLFAMVSEAGVNLPSTIFLMLHLLETHPPTFPLLAELVLTLANLEKSDYIWGRIKGYLRLFTGNAHYLKGLLQTKFYIINGDALKKDPKLSTIIKCITMQ